MSRHKNLMTRICFASVLSLGLAACGGKTVTPPTPMVATTPVAPTPVAPPVDPAALVAAQDAAMAARTAADDAQMAADAVADLTGDGSAQAMVAQAAADAAMAAATAAEEASARAQVDTVAADAVAEQMTAVTEQGKAETQLAMALELQRESQVAADAAGQVQQARDIADAQDAAKAAAAAALDHFNSAHQKATDARAKAVDARDAADRAVRARTDSGAADTQATAAEEAADAAWTARGMAWTAVVVADAAVVSAMGATTSADAQMYQEAAETAETTAEAQAMDADMNYMTAMKEAADAETAADTHVLGLFTSANASGETDEKAAATAVASVGVAIAAAAKRNNDATNGEGGQAGMATAEAAWAADVAAEGNAKAVPGLLKIVDFNSMVDGGTEMFTSDTVGNAKAVPAVKPNAKQTNVGGDFPHMFDISSGKARVLVFTDKEQDTPAVVGVTAATFVNAPVAADQAGTMDQIVSLGESSDDGASFPGTFDDDTMDMNPAAEGTFKCTGTTCVLVHTGSGGSFVVTQVEGYTFSGRRESVEAVDFDSNRDYLLFGVWLDENAAGADTFGAIAMGGQPFTNPVQALEGTATYSGTAVGAHHKTGSGVSSFDGDANLTAAFGTGTTDGSIKGTIDNISVGGGDPMEEPIHLVKTLLTTGDTFNGDAVMGQQVGPGLATHTFNGTWSGGFFGNGKEATDHPGSVAGTFGVTNPGTGDDPVTESYVGAFGAHQQPK